MLNHKELTLDELDLIGEYLTTPSDKMTYFVFPEISAEFDALLHARLQELLSSTKSKTTPAEWKEVIAIYRILNALRDRT